VGVDGDATGVAGASGDVCGLWVVGSAISELWCEDARFLSNEITQIPDCAEIR
jgi:hypothetical protein